MKIEVYSNNRSVKPVTAWESVADMYNFLEENKNIAAVCAKIRETGDKSFKSQLPAMMPMGRVGDKTRKKENCVPTGLVMLDIDSPLPASPRGEERPCGEAPSLPSSERALSSVAPDSATSSCPVSSLATPKGEGVPCGEFLSREEMKKWVEKMRDELEKMQVVMVHITPSGRGLRLLVHCHEDGMEATVMRCAEVLELERFGKVDPACKDLSRLSYLVPAEYIVYERGLFDEVPEVSVEAMRKLQWTGTMEKNTNVHTKLGEVEANDAMYRDFEYNGFKVADIVKDYIASTGGEPLEGTRHTFYNEMVVLFRNLCNNDAKIVHAVLPMFGNSVEETWAQCVSLCSSNRSTKIDGKLYFWLKRREMLASRTLMENEQEEVREPLPPMPKLPPVFRQYVNAAPDDFKVPTVIALLPILGTLTSHLRSAYFDDSEQSTEFISLLFAPPSSGKSFIKRLSKLLQNLRDRDELANAREELYALNERKKGANEKGEDAPKVSVRIVKPLISVPELLTKMRNNQGHHMYIEAEELDTFNKGNKTAGGDKSDLWRVTWDNGYYGQYYKSVNTFKGEVQMFMNLLFTGTQDQIDRFFKNVEDGLVTRFSVCPIENQTYAKFTPWKRFSKADELLVKNVLDRLEMKNYKMPLKFDMNELEDIKKEEFDAVVPWQYEFQPFEHVDLSYIYPTLLQWLEEERIKAASTLDEARDVFRKRAAVKGFRLALLCHGLYGNVGKKEKQVITDFVRWFCMVDLSNSLYLFGERYNELQQRVKKGVVRWGDVFNKLAETFTRADLRVALQRSCIKTPLKVVLSLWTKNGLIENDGENFVKMRK